MTAVAYPPEIPMHLLDFGQLLGVVDGPNAGKFEGEFLITPDHDRAVLTSSPVLYLDDLQRAAKVTDGRATALLPASTIPGATWTEVRYLVEPNVTAVGGGRLTLPTKTLFLEPGAPLDGGDVGYATPTSSYWALTSDTGSGAPSTPTIELFLAGISDLTEWSSTEDYQAGANVQRNQGLYVARIANTGVDPELSPSTWWLTGVDGDTI